MQKELKKSLNKEIIVLCTCQGEVRCIAGTLHQIRDKSLTIINKQNIGNKYHQNWIDEYLTISYSDIERLSTGQKVL